MVAMQFSFKYKINLMTPTCSRGEMTYIVCQLKSSKLAVMWDVSGSDI